MILHVLLIVICTLFTMNRCLFASVQKNEIKKNTLNLSLDDRKSLENFLRRILFAEGFAYTLFGDKPISSGHFRLDEYKKIDSYRSKLSGYRVLEKYAYLFPQGRFIFLFYENLDEECCEVTLINKKAFHIVVDKYKKHFSKIFGPEITSEQLLNLLVQKRSLWNTSMRDHDDVIGILLGFGEVNAELFQKRGEILGKNSGIKKNRTSPSLGYHSTDEELAVINASLKSFSDEQPNSLYYMHLPGFAADLNHTETIQLKKKYTEQRKHITQLYSQGNVIDTTLEKLYAK